MYSRDFLINTIKHTTPSILPQRKKMEEIHEEFLKFFQTNNFDVFEFPSIEYLLEKIASQVGVKIDDKYIKQKPNEEQVKKYDKIFNKGT